MFSFQTIQPLRQCEAGDTTLQVAPVPPVVSPGINSTSRDSGIGEYKQEASNAIHEYKLPSREEVSRPSLCHLFCSIHNLSSPILVGEIGEVGEQSSCRELYSSTEEKKTHLSYTTLALGRLLRMTLQTSDGVTWKPINGCLEVIPPEWRQHRQNNINAGVSSDQPWLNYLINYCCPRVRLSMFLFRPLWWVC